MRPHIHYEAAFEDYLRLRGLPYIPVDEARKADLSGERIKSFDFLVYGTGGRNWLLDVKGRKFPYDTAGARRYWENWVLWDDLHGLLQWQEAFGEGFSAAFLFAYWLLGDEARRPTEAVHMFRNEVYSFLAVPVEFYKAYGRARSRKWETLSLPTARFRELARPVAELLEGAGC